MALSAIAQHCYRVADLCASGLLEDGDYKVVCVEGEVSVVLEILVPPEAIRFVLGFEHRTFQSLACLLQAIGKGQRKVHFDIVPWG